MISFSARIRVNPPNFMIDFGYELELNHCPFIASTPIPEYTGELFKIESISGRTCSLLVEEENIDS